MYSVFVPSVENFATNTAEYACGFFNTWFSIIVLLLFGILFGWIVLSLILKVIKGKTHL